METSSSLCSASEATSQPPSHAALSIYETVRRHCRARLLVEPLEWTSLHLELLQCSFNDPCPMPPTTQSNFTGARDGTQHLKHFFMWPDKFVVREHSMLELLADEECPLDWRKNLHLYLTGYRPTTLPCTTFSLRDDSESDSTTLIPPIAAHIDRGHITVMRRRKMLPNMFAPYNPPVNALCAIKLRKVVPTEPLHDPYIAALLIALAQLQRRMLQQARPEEKAGVTSFPSKVFCTSEENKDCMHLYSANISSSLLDKFDHPTVSPPAHPSLSIQITTIPYSPHETLRDRLLALIFAATRNHHVERKRKMEDEGGTQPLPTRHKAEDLTACT